VCVNPLSIEEYDELEDDQIVVRSFKTGKLSVVGKFERLTRSSCPNKVEASWKGEVLRSYVKGLVKNEFEQRLSILTDGFGSGGATRPLPRDGGAEGFRGDPTVGPRPKV